MKYLHLLLEQYRNLDSSTRLRGGIVIAACLAVVVALSAVNGRTAYMEKQRVRREKDVADMLVLKQSYQTASSGAQKLANRLAATRPDDSPAKLIDEIGIKGKGVTIRSVKGNDLPGMVEDAADVRVEGLSANEAVNLLHRLEKGNKPVIIKKALLKTRFDDPSRIDLAMTIALLKAAPQTPK
jgi:general secretion pathway protein M